MQRIFNAVWLRLLQPPTREIAHDETTFRRTQKADENVARSPFFRMAMSADSHCEKAADACLNWP